MAIKIYDADYFDSNYDMCGNETKVILEIDNIKIPLCHNCLETLKDQITEYEFSKF